MFYVESLECASTLFISGQYSSKKCASIKMSRTVLEKRKKVTFDLRILSASLHVPFICEVGCYVMGGTRVGFVNLGVAESDNIYECRQMV